MGLPGRTVGAAIAAAAILSISAPGRAHPPGGGDQSFSMAPSFSRALGESVSLGFSMPVSYRDALDAEALDFSATLELPVDVIRPAGGQPFGLRLTPFGTLAGSAASGAEAGGFSGDGGFQGTASLSLGGLEASFSSRISQHEGMSLSYDALEFAPGLSERVFENGVTISREIGKDVFFLGSLVHRQSREDTEVQERVLPGLSIGWRRPGGFDLTLAWQADLSGGSDLQQVQLMLRLPF